MSQTFNLICHDCRVALWIGQGSYGEGHRYIYGTDDARAAQARFLLGHIGHRLEVNDVERTDLGYATLDSDGAPFE